MRGSEVAAIVVSILLVLSPAVAGVTVTSAAAVQADEAPGGSGGENVTLNSTDASTQGDSDGSLRLVGDDSSSPPRRGPPPGKKGGPPSDAGVTKVDSCRVIDSPGRYQVTGQLNVEGDVTEPCIRVTSSDVRLYGERRAITENAAANGTANLVGGDTSGGAESIGVYVAPESGESSIRNVIVSDLVVEDWTTGILFENVEKGAVRNNIVTGNHVGVQVYGRQASGITLEGNVLTSNGRAVAIEWATDSRVIDNEISGNLNGVQIAESSDVRVANNNIDANRGKPIELARNSRGNTIRGNTLRENARRQIATDRSSRGNRISANAISKSGQDTPVFASSGLMGTENNRARGAEQGNASGGAKGNARGAPGNLGVPAEENLGQFSMANPATSEALTTAFADPGFNGTGLSVDLQNPTSLQFGPDGRLYVAQQNGLILALTVDRVNQTHYNITDVEEITAIQNDIPNHDDDGTLNTNVQDRLITGILVTGTAENPVIYVPSSDPRIGGGGNSEDTGLDTNSGTLSKLQWDGSEWDHTLLMRGLPRSEENHHPNGMALDEANDTLYIATGGNTNKGATSNNFVYLPEYALSAAILSIDLNQIEGMSTEQNANGVPVKYDIPTLQGTEDPFGGQGGANQAILTENGPIDVYAPGFRNAYDVVLTQDNQMYTVDNGANSDWGGPPVGEGTDGTCTNEPNEDNSFTDNDELHYVSGEGYYGGHPNPTRGNENVYPGAVYSTYDRPIECDYQSASTDDDVLATFTSSTNGLDEYTSTAFGGAMQGDLLAAGFGGNIWRLELDESGSAVTSKTSLFSNFGSKPLDVTAQGNDGPFNGTVWATTYGSSSITVFTPSTNEACLGTDDPSLDEDGDGFSNADEIDNGADPCSAASVPPDNDGDDLSDLNDFDDDNDGISDLTDPFAIDANDGQQLPVNFQFEPGSYAGTLLEMGFTGVMSNGEDNYRDLYDTTRLTAGGAANVLSVDSIPEGSAYEANNDQQYGFQVGVKPEGKQFTARTTLKSPLPDTPVDDQSQGFYVGNGDQDNYVKLVASANGGDGGIQFAKEVDGTFEVVAEPTVTDVTSAQTLDLYMTVDPADDTITAAYSIDGGQNVTVGTTSFPGEWAADPDQGLALGVISTSRGPGDQFSGTWSRLVASSGTLSSGNQPPTAAFDYSPVSPGAGETISFDASSSGDVDGTIQSYEWDFDGDGTTDATGPTPTHTYSGSGTESVTLTVTDGTGATDSYTEEIYVEPAGTEDPVTAQIDSCGVIDRPGTYTLTSDIQDSSDTPCLEVTTSDVVIDGAGHTIDGDTSVNGSAHVGVLVEQPGTEPETVRNVTVEDLTLTEWNTGIAYRQVADGQVRDNVISDSINGIQLFGTTANTGHTVNDNTVYDTQRGIAVEGTTDSLFTNNNVSGNYEGLYLLGASGNTIRNHVLESNTRRAILLDGSGPDNLFQNVDIGSTNVTFQGRNVSVASRSNSPDDPDGLESIGNAVQSEAVGPDAFLDLTIQYAGIDVASVDESTLSLWSYDGSWTEVNGATLDADANRISANTTQLGTLAPLADEPPVAYRVNSGGSELAALDSSIDWDADNGSDPSPYVNDAATNTFSTQNSISLGGSVPDDTPEALFQTERYNQMQWEFPVNAGATYEVRLHFAELYWTQDGQRVFDVAVENQLVLDNYDIHADVGYNGGVTKAFQVTPDSTLDVDFGQVVDNPKVSGIEIVKLTDNSNNQVPTADISYSAAGETVSFDASGSSDPDGSIQSYAWDFDGDGTTDATGPTPTHTYASGGEKSVTLTVTDEDGAAALVSETVTLTSTNQEPVADFSFAPVGPTVDESTTFDGSGSSDSDGSIQSYEWDFDGDGTVDATGPTPTHTYTSSGIKTPELTVTDDDGDSDTVTQCLAVAPANGGTGTDEASVSILPNTGINSSTYSSGSFAVSNTGQTDITVVEFDLSTGKMPDMVFDPNGTAGDKVAKDFSVDTEGGTGYSCHSLAEPHDGNPENGYDVLRVAFTDFQPGETFEFSIDVDPSSIKGDDAPGPAESGSVSGLELTRSTVSTGFESGTTQDATPFSDGSLGGSQAVVKTGVAAAPTIDASGASLQSTTLSDNHTAATVAGADQTIEVSGPAGATVRLLRLEAGQFTEGVPDGGYDLEAYEGNSVIEVSEQTATIGSDGTVDVGVTLTNSTDAAGLNYITAVVEDGAGETGLVSDVVVLRYNPDAATTQPPSAEFSYSPTSPTTGETVSFDASTSSDSDGSIQSYAWDFDGDGTVDETTSSATTTYTYSSTGDKSVTLTVTDDDGATDQTTQTVSVGSTTTEDTVVYRLNNGGSELTASDGSINWGADTSSNPSTYLNSIEDKTYSTGDSISLDSSVSSDTPAALFQSERWDSPTSPEMQWDFPVTSGETYEVRLYFAEIYYTQDGQRVFDVSVENQVVLDNYDIHADVGHDTGVAKTFQVTPDSTLDIDFGHVTENPKVAGIEIVKLSSGTSNQAPAADFSYSPTSPTTGETVSFDASASSDSDGSVESYEWDFDGDGTVDETTSSATTTYTYSTTGDNTVTLTVTDDDGATDQTTQTVSVGSTTTEDTVVYRVNNGGSELTASDDAVNWGADTSSNPSTYLNAIEDKTYSTSDSISLDGSVPSSTPTTLFQTERWDTPTSPEMQWDFPVTSGETYEVRLYFAEIYYTQDGQRVFDVSVENQVVLDNYDIHADGGHDTGVAKTFQVTPDSNLDVDFGHVTENPKVSGIEIVKLSSGTSNQAPAADFSYSPSSPTTGETVSFDASASSDSDGSVESYEWDFDGDGTVDETTSSATTSYTYSSTGDKTATLTVTDDDGATDQTTQTVSVGDTTTEDTVVYRVNNGGSELTASDDSINWDADTSSNPSTYRNDADTNIYSTSDSISLDSSVSSSTPATLFQTERWDPAKGAEMQWDFPVTSGETYEVRLYFAELYWTQDGKRVFDVAVENQVVLDNYDIHADVGHDTGVAKTFQVTPDSNLDVDFDHVTDNPKVSGIEIVKLSGGTSNQAPSAEFSYSPSSPTTGETVSFDASASSDSDGSIQSYAWDFDGDGTVDETTSSATTTHTYSSTGDKSATLTVTDDDGATDQTTQTVSVGDTTTEETVVYRLNNGGSELTASDDSIDWGADTSSNPSTYLNAIEDKTYSTSDSISLDGSVASSTPTTLFQSERWDLPASPEMQWDFPVNAGETYEVRLYFAEIYHTQDDQRVFDVSVEDQVVFDNYDIHADVGHDTGVVKTYQVTPDSTLDIDFGHVTGNPKVAGIEIVKVNSAA